jgi:hypothetical protein
MSREIQLPEEKGGKPLGKSEKFSVIYRTFLLFPRQSIGKYLKILQKFTDIYRNRAGMVQDEKTAETPGKRKNPS